jgi:hypothetical protein
MAPGACLGIGDRIRGYANAGCNQQERCESTILLLVSDQELASERHRCLEKAVCAKYLRRGKTQSSSLMDVKLNADS